MRIHQFVSEGHFAEEGKGSSEQSVLQLAFSLYQSSIKGSGALSLNYVKSNLPLDCQNSFKKTWYII